MAYSIDMACRVFDDSEGVYLEVRNHAENADYIEIHTPDKQSKEYYGDLSIVMPKEQALHLIKALQTVIDFDPIKAL